MFSRFRPPPRSILMVLAVSAAVLALTPAVQASAADLAPFTCTDRSGGVASAAATIYDIRVAHHDGYDRLVIGFPTANTLPQYLLTRQATSTFMRDASGQSVTLDGSAGTRIVLRNTNITQGVPTDVKPQLLAIREVDQIGNFEGVVSYGMGLATPACFRVLELTGPTRLVIDVQTPADAIAATSPTPSAAPSASTGPSTVASQPATAADLAETGHPAQPAQPATLLIVALILGLLVVAGGLTIASLRRFARK